MSDSPNNGWLGSFAGFVGLVLTIASAANSTDGARLYLDRSTGSDHARANKPQQIAQMISANSIRYS